MTLYNNEHFFYPNGQKRFSLGTKNKNLHKGADGSLTLYVGRRVKIRSRIGYPHRAVTFRSTSAPIGVSRASWTARGSPQSFGRRHRNWRNFRSATSRTYSAPKIFTACLRGKARVVGAKRDMNAYAAGRRLAKCDLTKPPPATI
jgi:hypothetical protein